MNNFNGKRSARLVVASALLLAAGLAQAQYVWINEKGVRQISDKAPPGNIPIKNILKAPGGVPTPPPAAAAPAQGMAPAASAEAVPLKDGQTSTPVDTGAKTPAGPMTLAEREADYKKRMKAKAEQEEKDKLERDQKAMKKAQCASAKEYKAVLDANTPLVSARANGETVPMSDAERQQRSGQAKRAMADCK